MGGAGSFQLNSGYRNVQDVFVAIPGGQRLDLDTARFFLKNTNLRLRIRVSAAESPNNTSFQPRVINSSSGAGEFGNRVLLVNDFSDFALLRLTVAVVAKARATVYPSDGWALRLIGPPLSMSNQS